MGTQLAIAALTQDLIQSASHNGLFLRILEKTPNLCDSRKQPQVIFRNRYSDVHHGILTTIWI
ncbi:hypothetical protein ACN4EK_11785 [Pantanalinema rosaneae CENA516]|uniref:hypothetical protein n=1 Tax=Pantanalinema rosaneae TaxID=1620701 RepID=UPI003D6F2F4A